MEAAKTVGAGKPHFLFSKSSFPCGSAGKESAHKAGDLGSIPGLGRFPGEGKGYPLQCSGLENSMVCIIYGVSKSWKGLTFTFIAVTEGFLGGSAVKNLPAIQESREMQVQSLGQKDSL